MSALALYCLEQENMDFVLHTAMDEAKPWANQTVQSRNRCELLARTGSRYAPASPCDGLGLIEASARPCVFIGKPCDTAAVAMLRNQRPELDRKLGLVLTFFCAGTPSTQGTLDLLKGLDISPAEVAAVRYRGEGWPGEFKVRSRNEVPGKSLSYAESWGRLTGYRPLRCHLCPDGLGRVAKRARDTYTALLAHLSQLRRQGEVWMALPKEVDHWWRDRARMKIAGGAGGWRIEGPGRERARLAYASLTGDRISYSFDSPVGQAPWARVNTSSEP